MNAEDIKAVIAEYEKEKQQEKERRCSHSFTIDVGQGYRGGQTQWCHLCGQVVYFTWEKEVRS